MQFLEICKWRFSRRKVLIASISVIAIILASSTLVAFASTGQPVSSHPIVRITNSTSSNWSGYASESSTASPSNNFVKSVLGSWTVPSLTCTSGQATYVAVWIGIDGYSDGTVEQTGTEQQCNSDGSQTYYAWYEMYPHGMVQLFSVSPGDAMSASVSYQGRGSFLLAITDSTHSNSYSTTQTLHNAKLQSAEWIVEAPYSGGVLPLANFGSESFTGAQFTTMSGQTLAIDGNGQGTYDSITMNDPANGAVATPSGLTDSSFPQGPSSFSVTYSMPSSSTSTTTSTTSTTTTTTTTSSSTSTASGTLGVTLTCNAANCTYPTNTFAYITVTVTNSGGTAVSGASVTLQITTPTGGVASGSGTTNSNGQLTFRYRIYSTTGTYSMLATATYGSATGSASGNLYVT